jgi:hypothetical protein
MADWGARLSALIPTNQKCHLKNELAVSKTSLGRLACRAYGAYARRSPRTATAATEVQHEDHRNALDGKVLQKTPVLAMAQAQTCHRSRKCTKVASEPI